MLIKEYRIALPLSVDEYRIAQLYMIQRKSREESKGTESGVEIIVNEPYEDGPGGCGQYTHKIYHIGSHLPGWFQTILPRSALTVEEEAWNAYPYTKTVYRCPFVQKFSLEIETRYFDDSGQQENVFRLSGGDLRNRVVDKIDIVNDVISASDYKEGEDPTLFVSAKSGRGPLSSDWLNPSSSATATEGSGTVVMCAYKLCKVEFRYWGMQNKIERFIHDVGLRKTMLHAHRQAWCWQDEYDGLDIDDIRRLEDETQKALQIKMATAVTSKHDMDAEKEKEDSIHSKDSSHSIQKSIKLKNSDSIDSRRDSWFSVKSYMPNTSPNNNLSSSPSLEHLMAISSDSETDSFYDAEDEIVDELNKTTQHISMDDDTDSHTATVENIENNHKYLIILLQGDPMNDDNTRRSLQSSFEHVLTSGHYGCLNSKQIEFATLKPPSFCKQTDDIYHRFSFRLRTETGADNSSGQFLTSIPSILSACHTEYYQRQLSLITSDLNTIHRNYVARQKNLKTHISLVTDRLGSIIAYDILSKTSVPEETLSLGDNTLLDIDAELQRNVSCPPTIQHGEDSDTFNRLQFSVDDLFAFQSPLAYILVHRISVASTSPEFSGFKFTPEHNVLKPLPCNFYNIYYSADPNSIRLEPLIYESFKSIPAFPISIFSKFPLGNAGFCNELEETIDEKQHELMEPSRRESNASVISGCKPHGYGDILNQIQRRWWGKKRIDYVLQNTYDREKYLQKPESTQIVINNSFYESNDVAAFIIRQIIGPLLKNRKFKPTHPMEKWQKRSNRGIQNKSSNHTGNDVFIIENQPILIPAKFAYGVLGRNLLKGEFVDIYYKSSSTSDWMELGQTITDQYGKVVYEILERLAIGIYPILMVVRGDHTMMELMLIIVPEHMPVAVFSIDGTFAANFSISGREPKIRLSSVELVSHWRSLGYYILYVTARPEIQRKKVNKWFHHHGFPRSTMNFTDSISLSDPCRQKTNNIQDILQNGKIKIHAAYGSNKDIPVYQSLGVDDSNIYIVSKSRPKLQSINFICDNSAIGYQDHVISLRYDKIRASVHLPTSLDYSRYTAAATYKDPSTRRAVGKTFSLPLEGGSGAGAGDPVQSKLKRWSRKIK